VDREHVLQDELHMLRPRLRELPAHILKIKADDTPTFGDKPLRPTMEARKKINC